MDPFLGQNLSNTLFVIVSVIVILLSFFSFYLNFIADKKNTRRHDPRLKTVQLFLIFASIFVLLSRLSSSYFENLAATAKPYRQPIRTATATVEIFINSSEPYNRNHFIDEGGYLGFGQGTQALLITSAIDCLANQEGGDRVKFRGVFAMTSADPSVGQLVTNLRKSEYVQIEFLPMPKPAHVIGGRAIVLINNDVQLDILIPEQDTNDGKIYVRDLKQAFSDFR